MTGIRNPQPSCDCIHRLYDCSIYGRIDAGLPSSVHDVPIEINLGSPSTFEILQHGCIRLAVAVEDFKDPQIMRFSRNTSFIPTRRDWIDKHLLWSDSDRECRGESFAVRSVEQLATLRLIDIRTHCEARDSPNRGNRAVE